MPSTFSNKSSPSSSSSRKRVCLDEDFPTYSVSKISSDWREQYVSTKTPSIGSSKVLAADSFGLYAGGFLTADSHNDNNNSGGNRSRRRLSTEDESFPVSSVA